MRGNLSDKMDLINFIHLFIDQIFLKPSRGFHLLVADKACPETTSSLNYVLEAGIRLIEQYII